MESVFLNGGFIGKTLDFGDTDKYQIGTTTVSRGQQAFSTAGTFSWTAPEGITSVSVVAVGGGGGGGPSGADASSGGGGGGLGWKNNISVTPGQSYTVVVGNSGAISSAGGQSYFINASTVAGNGGSPGVNGTATGGAGGTFVGDGGGNGGQGGNSTITDSTNSQSEAGAGGGAGGYSGNGGRGAGTNQFNTGGAGTGGGGGGGGSPDSGQAGGGGGVGMLGQGANGAGGSGSTRGGGGSGGLGGSTTPTGGNRGGGGAGADASTSGAGGTGGVRIIWGANRAYPSTNTADNAGSDIEVPVFGNQKNSGIWLLQSVYDNNTGFSVDIISDGLSIYLDSTNPTSYPGTGTTWFDLSGNGRNFTWNSVSYTAGLPSYFSTSGRRCTGPSSNSVGIDNTSGYTIFVVALQNSLTGSSAFKFYKGNFGETLSSSRGIFSHCTFSDGVIYFDQGGCCASDTRTNVSGGTTTTWNIYTFRRLTNSSTRSILKNGSVLATNTNSAATIDLDSRGIDIGGTAEDTAWNARLGGFIVYNRGLSDQEVSTVYDTLRTRYGI